MIQDIAPHRLANEYQAEAVPDVGDWVLYVRGQELGVRRVDAGDPEAPGVSETAGAPACDPAPVPSFVFPQVGEPDVPTSGLTYLFSLDGRACWLAPELGQAELPAGYELVSNRDLRMEGRGSRELMYVAYTAVHLADWYASNRFCGRCGSAMEPHPTLRALRCPSCGALVFPRLNPAIIACVCDPARERIVLTRYARGRYMPIDALVAGFVEIGETVEDCVRREVREELGLEVDNIRYYKSQPWGVAGDILMGFWCDVVGDPTIHRDKEELGMAVWAAPDQIAGQPDDLSLTNEMMCVWRDAHLA